MSFFNPFQDFASTHSRRDFVKLAGGCGLMGGSSYLSTLFNLRLTASAMADTVSNFTDYKALVCVFLFGGNDSYNMLAPYEDAEHADYVEKRGGLHPGVGGDPEAGGLAIPKDYTDPNENLIPIQANGGTPFNGMRNFGIHPRMGDITIPGRPELQGLAQIYRDGNAAFVANVGTLIQPTTRSQYNSNTGGAFRPRGIFSHSDEQRNWQTAKPQDRQARIGWLGRIADCIQDAAKDASTLIPISMAIDNSNIIQTGEQVLPYIINRNSGAIEVRDYPLTNNTFNRIRTATTDGIVPSDSGARNLLYSDLLERTYANKARGAIDEAIAFNDLTSGSDELPFDPNDFSGFGSIGDQAERVARTIFAAEKRMVNGQEVGLGHKRQIFMMSRGGFDNHNNVVNAQVTSLFQVAGALSALYKACMAMGVADKVCIFTVSDFARTLNTNTQGSDHAWGSNQLVIKQGLNADIYGRYPTSLLDAQDPDAGNLDLNRGRLLATTAVDEYYRDLALWFGLPQSELSTVFPNIGNFSSTPLGIL